MSTAEDIEALIAQMDKEYEEAETKKKEKKNKGKGKEVSTINGDNVDNEKEIVKEKKPSQPKKKTEPKLKQVTVSQEKTVIKIEVKTDNTKKNDQIKELEAKETTKSKEETTKSNEEATKSDGQTKKKKGNAQLKLIKEALAIEKEIEEDFKRKEEDKLRAEEKARLEFLEEERLKKERKAKKKLREKQRIEKLKLEGKYLTKAQKEIREKTLKQLEALGIQIPQRVETVEEKKPTYAKIKKLTHAQKLEQNQVNVPQEETLESKLEEEIQVQDANVSSQEDIVKEQWDLESENETESGSESEESICDSENVIDRENNNFLTSLNDAKQLIQKNHEAAEKLRSTSNLRAPVVCVLGHVDTGKTTLLDNLRRTRVQEDEAGGITQQIGATNVPLETLRHRTKMCKTIYQNEINVPGLLIIDTPGHESFKSLRSRGTSLCDIAILVIDIMHGLEPQTIESINILREKKTPFVVALNKIDRLFGWKSLPELDIVEVLNKQATNVRNEFEKRSQDIMVQLSELGLNSALFYENKDIRTYISIIPTSAHTSDGTGNLIALIIEFSQTILAKKVSYSTELQCTVLEVKVLPSLGTTIDVCLVNGKLKICDTIIVPGQEGPIVTQIRGLLMPAPNKEIRVKNPYTLYKEILGAQGVKIIAQGLEKAMPGLPLFVSENEFEIDYYKEELKTMLKQSLSSIKLSDLGVFVQASTLGSLEALLEFLKNSKIPYAGINIGPVHKKDVSIASIMLQKDPQWAVILAFDVKIEREAQDLADHLGVRIFSADIIFHLFDKFMGYRDDLLRQKREKFKDIAVFPCKLKILPECIFNKRDPIVIGVKVESGFIKTGTPITAINEEAEEKLVDLGRVTSIEYNHNNLEVAKQGQEVCIKIENPAGLAPKMLGRHFNQKDLLISKISRESIDAVKDYFRDEMTYNDWLLLKELKQVFQII